MGYETKDEDNTYSIKLNSLAIDINAKDIDMNEITLLLLKTILNKVK